MFDYSKELKCSELLTSYSKRYITTILIKDPVLTLSVDQFSTKQTSVQPKKLISLLRIHEQSVVFLILTQVWKSKKYFFDIYSTYTCPYDYFSCEHCYSRVLYPITVDMGLPSFISITKTEKCFGLHRFYGGTAVYFKRALKKC